MSFNGKEFFGKKTLLFTKAEEWKEGNDRDDLRVVGTKVTASIVFDGADYGKNGNSLNEGEFLTIKVQQPLSYFADWKAFDTFFRVTEITKASIYGDFRNQLSVTVPTLEKLVRKQKDA